MSAPSHRDIQAALKAGYKFVVWYPGVWGMGIDPCYCKTRREAQEVAREDRKRGWRPRIESFKAMFARQAQGKM